MQCTWILKTVLHFFGEIDDLDGESEDTNSGGRVEQIS